MWKFVQRLRGCARKEDQLPSTASDNLLDLSKPPLVPDGFKVETNREGGKFRWDLEEAGDYLQNERRHELVFNAALFDFLLRRPQDIPSIWEDKIPFEDTIYSDKNGRLYVPLLERAGGVWRGHLDRWYYNIDSGTYTAASML